MGSTVKQIFYIENVEGFTPRSLAEHLAAMSKCSPRWFEVVLLYGKLQSSHPLCAAICLANIQYRACIQWNNKKFRGTVLKMVQFQDCRKITQAQWILFPDGSRISVKGSSHWAIDLSCQSICRNSAKDGHFHKWETIKTQGREDFCYAAFDCGCMIQEKATPGQVMNSDRMGLLMEKIVASGVQRLVLLGSSIRKAERAKALAAVYPDHLAFSVGYHPDISGAWREHKLSDLQALASHPACVAIGECGFDSTRTSDVHPNLQYNLLKTQVKLACSLRKPLLIYEKQAQNVVLEVLRGFQDQLPPVAVRSGTWNCDFDLYIRHGYYIVVTGCMFLKDSKDSFFQWLRNAQRWQLDYLLLASGSPDKQNYPTFVDKVVCSEYQRAMLGVKKNQYTEKAIEWYNYSKTQWRQTTPLHLPILIELVADAAKISPAEVSCKCLENAKRFFRVIEKQQPVKRMVQRKGREGTVMGLFDCGWALVSFFLPIVLCFTAMYVVGYLRT